MKYLLEKSVCTLRLQNRGYWRRKRWRTKRKVRGNWRKEIQTTWSLKQKPNGNLFLNHYMRNIFFLIIIFVVMAMATKAASAKWTDTTTQRLNRLVEIGMPKDVATSLITHCKVTAKDPVHCIKIGASILGAESSLGTRCHRNNCVGMNDWGVAYTSKDAWIKAWVTKYNKWWFRQKDPSGFYRNDWTLPPTRYCMWKNKDGICKEWTANSWKVWNKLTNF